MAHNEMHVGNSEMVISRIDFMKRKILSFAFFIHFSRIKLSKYFLSG